MNFVSPVFLALLLSSVSPAFAEGKLEIRLEQSASLAKSTPQGLVVNVVFKNTGDRPIEFSSSFLPSEDGGVLGANLFDVKSGQDVADYQGIYAKNVMGSGGRVILGPGENVDRSVDLSQSYAVVSQRRYLISLKPLIRYVDAMEAKSGSPNGSSSEPKSATSNTLELTSGEVRDHFEGVVFSKAVDAQAACTQAQKDAVNEAILNAGDLALQSVTYTQSLLQSGSSGLTFNQTARYTKWYGAYGDPNDFSSPNGVINGRIAWRLNVNAIRLGKIEGQLPNPPALSTTCSCEKNGVVDPARTIAWVVPSVPYEINICPNFFSLPAIGNSTASDSKAGTILHEISHFNDGYTGGTSDLGDPDLPVSEAKFMAANGRDLAADNANNIEFYSENLEADQ